MQTMTVNGVTAPVITSGNYLVDLGPTTLSGRSAWFEQYRAALTEVGKRLWGGLPVPMEIVASGRTGRTVLRIFAPNPDEAIREAELVLDGDGPKVAAL